MIVCFLLLRTTSSFFKQKLDLVTDGKANWKVNHNDLIHPISCHCFKLFYLNVETISYYFYLNVERLSIISKQCYNSAKTLTLEPLLLV